MNLPFILAMLVEIQLLQQLRVSNQAIIWNKRIICKTQWLFKSLTLSLNNYYPCISFHSSSLSLFFCRLYFTHRICLVYFPKSFFFSHLSVKQKKKKQKTKIDFQTNYKKMSCRNLGMIQSEIYSIFFVAYFIW